MAKFRPGTKKFVFKRILHYWGNMVRNYDESVQNESFFDPVDTAIEREKGIGLIKAAYSPTEIKILLGAGGFAKDENLGEFFRKIWNVKKAREKCRVVLEAAREYILANVSRSRKEDDVEKRFLELKRVLGLSDLEYEVLLLAYIVDQANFNWPKYIDDDDKPMFFAMATDRSYHEIIKALSSNGKLSRFSLLDSDFDFNHKMIGGYINGIESEAISRRFYKENAGAEILPWEFFGALAEKDGAVLKRMLSAKPGKCNILLYGTPGTGKTSFARALAGQCGRPAWEIKQGDDNGENMNVQSRMVGIRICNGQEAPDNSLIVVDECDEILSGGRSIFGFLAGNGGSADKGVVNTILDEMKIPAVWISNTEACEIDESIRRRFDYSICFEKLDAARRALIWRNAVRKYGLGDLIGEERISRYAAEYPTSAGGISTVLENVRRMKCGSGEVDELVDTLMKPHCRLMELKEPSAFRPSGGYSLEGLNIQGKVKPGKLVEAVGNYYDSAFSAASVDRPRMNVLLHGAPGTGKTEFVKYLGDALGRKVTAVKGSDILGKYVGESEKNIAAAFRNAEAERAILFFDEIDGILQSRESAHASWEVSQVNELLQQMENFNGVMVAATNFLQNLDPAVMRRFTFKLKFDYLDDEGKKVFFERFFGTDLDEGELSELKALERLTPGDFRTVRQELFYLNEKPSNRERIAALREECELKGASAQVPIGFAD